MRKFIFCLLVALSVMFYSCNTDVPSGVSSEPTGSTSVAITSITLNPSADQTMVIGDTKTIAVSYLPANATEVKAVTWSSSDRAKVRVDDIGKITAVAAGEATITATLDVNDAIKASVKVTVVAEAVPVTSIEFMEMSPVEMSAGTPYETEIDVCPDNATDKRVTWLSSDETVATVDADGYVTGIKPGEATITVKSVSNPSVTASIVYKILPILVGEVNITPSVLTLAEKTSEQLTVGVAPSNATDKSVTWASSDETVATVDQTGKVTAVKPGTVTITATAKDGSGKFGTATVNVSRALSFTDLPNWMWTDDAVVFAWGTNYYDGADHSSDWFQCEKFSDTEVRCAVPYYINKMLLVRCVAGTTTPDWNQYGTNKGRVYNQTADFNLVDGTTSYSQSTWKEYRIIYFTNGQDWKEVSAYFFDSNKSGDDKTVGTAWPGTKMQHIYRNVGNESVYMVVVPEGADSVVFNGKDNDSDQKTKDIKFENDGNYIPDTLDGEAWTYKQVQE